MLDNNNINEIFSNDQQVKTRSKKIAQNPEKLRELQEQQQKHLQKLSKLSQLEEDEIKEEDNNDSDYDGEEDENKEKKKRAARPKKFTKDIRFGKINLSQYFQYESENVLYDYPNYNNIITKAKLIKPLYKICDVCFGFANYTCKICGDKYCSVDCYKIHKENKCTKFKGQPY